MTRGGQRIVRASERVETARLYLVRPTLADASEMFERYASDPDVTKYLGWPRHRTVADTEAYLTFAAQEWDSAPVGAYLIRDRSDGRLLGGTGLSQTRPHEFLTGYVLAKDSWGKGYATESLQAIVSIARGLGARRLYALCHAEHRASQHVLEKCGFARGATWIQPVAFPNLGRTGAQPVLCFETHLIDVH